MPQLLDARLWPLLAGNHFRHLTIAEWERLLGPATRKSVPLSLVGGERAESVRCPKTGVSLEVFENDDGSHSAWPPVENGLDSRIDGLAVEDLCLYAIDWPKLIEEGIPFRGLDSGEALDQKAGTGVAAKGIEMPREPDLTIRELKEHLDRRLDSIGHEFVSLKKENDDLKQDLAQSLSNIAGRVEPEYFQWIFAIMGAGSTRSAAKLLGEPSSSFNRKLNRYAARGGVYATLLEMTKACRNSGTKSVERFSEGFAGHQPGHVGDPGHIGDLLDGLENLNADNWPEVRGELIELVQEELL